MIAKALVERTEWFFQKTVMSGRRVTHTPPTHTRTQNNVLLNNGAAAAYVPLVQGRV